MPPPAIKVLMTGAGAPGAAGIIKCLQQYPGMDLVVADADPEAIGRYLHQPFVQIPAGTDTDFKDKVLEICKAYTIQVILPLVTRELLPLARNKELFASKGIHVLVSSEQSILIANNKSATYQYLSERGIQVPKHFVVRKLEEFIHAAFELGHPQKAFCFKPSHSNGSRGVRIVTDSLDESSMLFNEKPYNLNISYPYLLQILSSKSFPELLVSEYLPGDEYSVDCLANKGKAELIIPRIRKKQVNGISVKGSFVEHKSIIDYCRTIIEALNLHGNIGIQVKENQEGTPLLLEINPRVQGTIVAAMGAGVNLPLLAIKQELGIPVKDEEKKPVWGIGFARYWTEVFY